MWLTWRPPFLHPGPPLPVDVPLTITAPSGSYVRSDTNTSLAYVGSGNGSSAPEQYKAYHFPDTGDRSPLEPGQPALLQSVQTGMWCRLAPNPSNATQLGMVCDQPTAATALAFKYTGDGLAVDGVPLVSPGPGQPLLLANTTSAPVTGPTADNLTLAPVISPAGEPHKCCAMRCAVVMACCGRVSACTTALQLGWGGSLPHGQVSSRSLQPHSGMHYCPVLQATRSL
jgi:hypothetical protein